MKININGKDKELLTAFDDVVAFSYESIIELAGGLNPDMGDFIVTYSEGDNHGALKPFQKIEFRNDLHPVFKVELLTP